MSDAPPAPDPSAAAGRTWFVVGAAALTAAVFAALLAWATVTAPLSTADEPRHANSVLRLMQGGGWPDAKTAPMVEGIFVAAAEAGDPIAGDPLPVLPAPAERTVVGDLSKPGGTGRVVIDWMTQHPPGYYAVVAGALNAVGAGEWRWDQMIFAMRTVSALMAALAVPFVIASVRLITGSRAAALVGGAVLLAIPQYGHVLALVTNDALATLLGAVLMYLVARALLVPGRLNILALVSGVVLGMALLTKGLMLAAVPFVLVGMLVAGWRRGGSVIARLSPAAISMALGFVVGGWWWLRNLFVYGELQPSVFGSGRDEDAPSAEYSIPAFIVRTLARLNHTMWASFRAELDLPSAVTIIAGVLAVAAVACAFAFSRQKLVLAVLAVYPLLTFAIFAYHAWEIFWDIGKIRGVQGRYLYSALTLLAASVGLVWSMWVLPARRGVRMAASGLWILTTAACAVGGLWFAYDYLWSEVGVRAMLASGAVGLPAIAVIAGLFALAVAVAAAATLACSSVPPSRRDDLSAAQAVPDHAVAS